MEIRFKVNQAEAFRRGLSVPKSIVRVEVEPSELDEETRGLIADRLWGIDVCQADYDPKSDRVKPHVIYTPAPEKWTPVHMEAHLPTLEALIEAVKAEQASLKNPVQGPQP